MNLFSLMRQFTIRLRMLGAIGVVLGLLGLLGGAGMLGMFRINDMSQNFMDHSFAKVSSMAELRGEMGAIRQYEKDMIIGYEKPQSREGRPCQVGGEPGQGQEDCQQVPGRRGRL